MADARGRTPSLPVYHPRRDDRGRRVEIRHPTTPSSRAAWDDPGAVAVFVPGGPTPSVLNGLRLAPAQAPAEEAGWTKLVKASGQPDGAVAASVGEKIAAAGAVVLEPDGRVWLFEPTNHFGGYDRTFPKGKREARFSLEATAAREVFEETGLLVEIGAFLVDCRRDTGVARYFLARRVGGSPGEMGWETQAVWLVPRTQLAAHAPHRNDRPIVEAVLRGCG